MKEYNTIDEKGKSMKAKELVLHKPLISTYTSYGALFSIIGQESEAWVMNNFIQLRYAYVWEMFSFDKHQFLMSYCPGLNYYIFPIELLEKNYKNSLFNFIKESIDCDYYVFLYVDRFYMPQFSAYRKTHFVHEILISGYDMEAGTVTFSDNMFDGKFETLICYIEQIEEAYWKMDKQYLFVSDVRRIKHNVNKSEEFNLKKIKFELENYLNCVPSYDVEYEQEYLYGIQIYDKVMELLDKNDLSGEEYEVRTFHLIYEHKLLMWRRVQYMEENNYISSEHGLSECWKTIMEKALLIRNMVLKKNIMDENNKVSNQKIKIRQKLSEMQREEIELVKELIGSIYCTDEVSVNANLR